MVSAPLSSPTFSIPETASGAEAAASAINAKGGINGHPVKIITCNDQSNPNQAAQCAQSAVSQHVSAVTGFFLFGPQIFDATKAANIPVLDSQPVSPQSGTSSNSFPLNAGGIAEWYGLGRQLVKDGYTRVVLMPNNTAAGAYNASFAKQGIEAAHGTVIRSVTATAGSPDYASYVQHALAGGRTQAIVDVGTPEDFPKVVLAAKQAAFKGAIATVIGQVPPATAKSLAGSGVNVLVTSNFYVPPSPQASAFSADMSKYQPKAIVDVFSEGTWTVVQAIAQALKGKSQVNAAALTAALHSSSSLNAGPMLPTIDMSKKGPIPGNPRLFNADVIVLKVENGGYTPAGGFFNPFGS
jgi:ABC-type branched-subunit amino acid transport system substrate-binding protein